MTIQALNRLHKKDLVAKTRVTSIYNGKVDHNSPIIWTNKGVRYNTNPDNRQHEIDCGDFLVSLMGAVHPETERLTHWDYEWGAEEKKEYIKTRQFYFDRRFVLDDRLFFLEVDRGTKDLEAVRKQFERYVHFSESYPAERFQVLVTVQGYRHIKAEDRATQLFKILASLKRGNQFLITMHQHALGNPLGKVWKSPLDGNAWLSL